MPLQKQLNAIFDAERSLRSAERELLAAAPRELTALLSAAVDAAKREQRPAEAELRLIRLTDLCAQVPGPEMSDALVRILDDDNPAVRVQAAEALVDVAYDRYAEVARAIERAIERGDDGPAMRELPWVIAEVAEASALTLLERFVAHRDGEIAASGVEALASLGDPAAIPLLRKLERDPRMVTIEDEDQDTEASVGELAREAIALLGGD
jgi:HEAT repeat protein